MSSVYRERRKVKREIHNGKVIVGTVARAVCNLTLNTVAIMRGRDQILVLEKLRDVIKIMSTKIN